MNRTVDILVTDLRYLLAELGTDGGIMSPSIYDTAQVIRMAPPETGFWPAVEWLLAQRQSDGGWGDPAVPRARDVPTLAAILALYRRSERRNVRTAVQEGLAFLRRQAIHWQGPLPQDIPIGSELLLPMLLREAADQGLELPQAHYGELIALGKRRLALIERVKPGAGTTAVHSWEAWGRVADPALFDGAGGIGHSPAATAAWIQRAGNDPALADHVIRARRYLNATMRATGLDIPGVVPTAWPINRFEHMFGVYALMMSGLLTYPALQEAVNQQIASTAAALRPGGFSFSDNFEPDGDDSAAGLLLMQLGGYTFDAEILRAYERDDHFCSYPYEMQVSLSGTARAVHTLHFVGEDTSRHQAHLLAYQQPDGRWIGDKWNASWLYTTGHISQALIGAAGSAEALAKTLDTLVAYQNNDGGWGDNGTSSAVETAYAVMTIRSIAAVPGLRDRGTPALQRARQWMRATYRPFTKGSARCWIAKEMYRPYRVDRAFELSAMLMLELEQEDQRSDTQS